MRNALSIIGRLVDMSEQDQDLLYLILAQPSTQATNPHSTQLTHIESSAFIGYYSDYSDYRGMLRNTPLR